MYSFRMICAAFLMSTYASSGARLLAAQNRGTFDIPTSIRMTTFASHPGTQNGSIINSPNGKMSVFITSNGDINTNTVESTLWLVTQRDAAHALTAKQRLTPTKLVQYRATPKRLVSEPRSPVIFDVRWKDDSSALYYLAENKTGTRLYRVSADSPWPVLLSGLQQDVQQYALAKNEVVYAETPNSDRVNLQSLKRPPVEDINELSLPDILFPGSRTAYRSNALSPAVWLISPDGARHRISPQGTPDRADAPPRINPIFSVSPDGQYLIRTEPNLSIAASWKAYVPVPGFEDRRIDPNNLDSISSSNRWRLKHYVITNLRNGKTSDLIATPTGDSLGSSDLMDAAWSRDSRRLLLGNTTLPMSNPTLPETTLDHHICAAAVVEISTMRTNCLAASRIWHPRAAEHPTSPSVRLDQMALNSDGTVATLTFSGHGGIETNIYGLENGIWKQRPSPQEALLGSTGEHSMHDADAVELEVHQTLNSSPTLWASDHQHHSSICLWDPNPQLLEISIPQAEPFEWKDGIGYRWHGVIVTPPNYRPDKLYPLVIQTHGVSMNTFLIDGQYPTAEAARALASAGFVVLQMPYRTDHVGTPNESSDQVEGFRSAIAALRDYRHVDPTRVGIVAFSRTGFHIEKALVSAPRMFRAAVIADASSYNYIAYRLFGHAETFVSNDIANLIGARPEGEGLRTWLKQATPFRAETVQTPILIESMGPTSLLIAWDLYTSLKGSGKPVTVLYFQDSLHVLQQPQSIYRSQQEAVGWFTRWLKTEDTR